MKFLLNLKDKISFWEKLNSILPNLINKEEEIVGIDIGSNSVKIVQLRRKKGNFYLLSTGLKEFSYSSKEITWEEKVTEALRGLLNKIDIKRCQFVLCVNCSRTGIKMVTTPQIPGRELREAIHLEAKNYFPFSLDDSLIDFEILSSLQENGIKKYHLLVATSPSSTVNKFLYLVKRIGIQPTTIIPAPLALERIIYNSWVEKEEIIALLEIGKSFSELGIFKGKELVFQRKIPLGGDDFTQAMSGVLASDMGRTELSFDEAEEIKRKVGIPSPEENININDKVSSFQVLSMLQAPLNQLIKEIERCLEYYLEESGGRRVERLILLGGGASFKGLAELLSRELEIEVEVGFSSNILKIQSLLDKDEEKQLYKFALALGAGLKKRRGINLLPREFKKQLSLRKLIYGGLIVISILFLMFTYSRMNKELQSLYKRIEKIQIQKQTFKLLSQEGLEKNILTREPFWEDIFKELSNLIPPEAYLTELSMKGRVIILKGIVASSDWERVLSTFIIKLEKGLFKKVRLLNTKRIAKGESKFSLRLNIE